MIDYLRNIFLSETNEKIPDGLGVENLPYSIYTNKTIKSSEFKELLSEILLPKLKELGFTGKDFFYTREQEKYTEIIYFWAFKSGGAVACNLFVQFKNITRPDTPDLPKGKKFNYLDADFGKRLIPNEKENTKSEPIWFWVYQPTKEENQFIIEDIWRVLSIRGMEYFESFKNLQPKMEMINVKNYATFPEFSFLLLHPYANSKIVFFLQEYWTEQANTSKSKAFTLEGKKISVGDSSNPYQKLFI